MVAGTKDIIIEKGATFTITANFYTDEAGMVKKDLSGYIAKACVRLARDGSLLLNLNCDIPSDSTGTIIMSASAQLTASIPTPNKFRFDDYEQGVWDLTIIGSDGSAERVLQGKALVSPGGPIQ